MNFLFFLILYGAWLLVCLTIPLMFLNQHKADMRMRLAFLEEDVLRQIEARREEKLHEDAALIEFLTKWRESAKSDINTMAILVEEFRELTAPYTIEGDDTQN